MKNAENRAPIRLLSLSFMALSFIAPAFAQDSLTSANTRANALVTEFKTESAVKNLKAAKQDELGGLLSGCSADERRAFLGSLTFVNGEVASAQISDVESCLGKEGLSKLPSSFEVTSVFYNNRRCISNECEEHHGANCSSNCGKLPCERKCGGIELQDASSLHALPALKLSGFVSIESLLAGCSKETADRFVDSLVFVAGRPAKADLSLLASCAKSR